ncbi:gliding motility lipoprotein GldB [Winogradskyella alexanderae]|uniref:Gliding motility lipoprotein GldB n=1 Tax=Winogradskyella alexanderae TaxID=2877123 RepID=A0ABS7XWA4_9FLAO|nr:gliding motility lipoprotein GldB [Winogradskyella alexanderae]MCA0133296.1 gliding motility lipoprotein GldB [Winogradskyella alexanderae]
MFYTREIRIYSSSILMLFILSCAKDSSFEKEISKIDIDFTIERFDKAVRNASAKDLPKLKEAFPFLFSNQIPDSIWSRRLEDTLQLQLAEEVSKTFQDLKNIKGELTNLFQHLKYYDKTFSTPRVITLTNDVAYRDKTIVTDSIVLIALDNFLGEEHEFYQNIPRYIASNLNKSQISVDVARGYGKNYVYQSARKTFLDEMIYHGKLLHFKDKMIPFKTDAEKIGYTEEQISWAEANESQIWSYFVEKELLYSTDSKLPSRFIMDAPFSKFYLELDRESPGRLGQYIGWQIVRAYAERTNEPILSIMQQDPEEIFRESKFKPKK